MAACAAEADPELTGTTGEATPGGGAQDPGSKDLTNGTGNGNGNNGNAQPTEPGFDPAVAAAAVAEIQDVASKSSCAQYAWKDRGKMPAGYVKGVALVFARAVCQQTRSDVLVVAKAQTTDAAKDSLAHYSTIFSGLGMSNGAPGVDTLRHTYTLLLGLGMRESSGRHCVGRDTTATNTSADSAEAGAWQTSYDSRSASPELPKLFTKYKADSKGCLLDTFEEGVTCNAANWEDWGTGDGREFQAMEKSCPAFAAEYAAVMIRVRGGSAGHYGPLRTKAAEVRPECNSMFQQVQAVVEKTPSVCQVL